MNRRTVRRRAFGVLAITAVLLIPFGAGLVFGADGSPSAERVPDRPVDINKASVDELTGLPGVGPALAARIVAFRQKHGPFRRVEDLLKVKGIGEKSFQKIRSHVRVGNPK